MSSLEDILQITKKRSIMNTFNSRSAAITKNIKKEITKLSQVVILTTFKESVSLIKSNKMKTWHLLDNNICKKINR